MRAWSPLYFANAPIYHVMTSYDNLLQFMTHIHYCKTLISFLGQGMHFLLASRDTLVSVSLISSSKAQSRGITSGRRHHKWKGGITSGRRHHKWKGGITSGRIYIEKPAKVCQAVALSLP